MTLNRREFVQLGAAGAAAALTAGCKWPWSRPTSSLKVTIRGLVIVDRQPRALTVNVINAAMIPGLMQHEPFLVVPAAIIDPSTSAPSKQDPTDPTMRLFDLTKKNVRLDSGVNGAPTLDADDSPAIASLPATDAEWQSSRYSARLDTLCGASKITDRSKILSTLELEHGHLHCTTPDSQLGASTIWTFTRTMPDGTQKVVAKQAMSNMLVCDVPVIGSTTTFLIGTQPLVVKAGPDAAVTVRNLPPPGMPGVCAGAIPCVDHMAVFYDLVDAQFRPVAAGSVQRPLSPGVEPDYCPPGSI